MVNFIYITKIFQNINLFIRKNSTGKMLRFSLSFLVYLLKSNFLDGMPTVLLKPN